VKYKINIGCGRQPTEGWINFDNSPSIILSKSLFKYFVAKIFGFINKKEQTENINWNKRNKIFFADGKKHIPLPSNSAECIYTSHMLEHLSKEESISFLNEALRVLETGGILRIAVPDLKLAVNFYLQTQDADAFMERIFIAPPPINTLKQKIFLFFSGYRQHQWMYDDKSLSKLLKKVGFRQVFICKAGETNILNPGNLNLYEHSDESIYLEGLK
jgi:predicted SAM-dependent methyltransferase